MRKHHQKQILELLGIIRRAQGRQKYAECQEGALFICDFIFDLVGDGSKTEQMIVDYCELLFRAHNGESLDALLDERLSEVESSVKSELKPTRMEMTFISHKAAQSDAIESIYLAAKNDPDVDAYWVPVPHIIHKPGKNPNQTILEGIGFYDEKFDMVNWEEYDIKTRRPDVVFTFCPYNKGSEIITIHPDFYPESLKKATDMLVYSPYHVHNDIGATDEATVKGYIDGVATYFMNNHKNKQGYNLFATPGSVSADRVIVQSKNLQEIFFRLNKKAHNKAKDYSIDKFVALGSPKFDKVITSKQENFSFPFDWISTMEGKKVFFYNSTIVGAGQAVNIKEYLGKLIDVIRVFANRNDAVLWWRPHPFVLSTIKKTTPQLAYKFEDIIKAFKRSGMGIYDDTHDLHRAIARTDAYYGDHSSVLYMYALTGKPALIGKHNVLTVANDNPSESIEKAEFKEPDAQGLLMDYGFTNREGAAFDLNDFISFVCSEKNSPESIAARAMRFQKTYTPNGATAGQKIFEYAKSQIVQQWEDNQ